MLLRLAGRALSFALVGAAAVFLYRAIGGSWSLVGERLRAARTAFVALTLLASFLYYLVWATRWRLMLWPVARVPWWPAQKALMASVFINTVVPFARSLGGLVRAMYLGRACRLDIAPLYGITLLDQVGYTSASLACGALFVPLAATEGSERGGRLGTGLGLAAASLLILSLVLRYRSGLVTGWIRRRIPGAGEAVEAGAEAAGRALSRPATWLILPAGGTAQWLCSVLAFAMAGRAVGADFTLTAAAAAFTIGSFVGLASGTPGGIGTTEAAAVAPLVALGYDAPATLAGVLLARLTQYVAAVTIGGACFLTGAPPPRSIAASAMSPPP